MSDTVVIDANAPLIVVGCGNTGSPFAALIPGIPGAGPVLFVDYDSYEAKNLVSQRILPCDVGKPKAAVQARWLRRFGVRATAAFVGRIEDVPWGWLRGGILVSCVDSRGARLYMNQVAWRLGLPLVDVAVDGPDLLARVSVYLSGDDAPCLECAWHEGHYRNLAKEYHCDGSTAATAATNAPSALGALAAGLQAIEVSALLGTGLKAPAVSRQAMFDLRNQTCTVTRFTRNPACRFDHQRWDIRILDVRPEDVALGDVFAEAALSREPSALSLEHRRFTRALTCANGCGRIAIPLRLADRLTARQRLCRLCGERNIAAGFDLVDQLVLTELSAAERRRSLAQLGLRPGDVFTVSAPDRSPVHLQLACNGFAHAPWRKV